MNRLTHNPWKTSAAANKAPDHEAECTFDPELLKGLEYRQRCSQKRMLMLPFQVIGRLFSDCSLFMASLTVERFRLCRDMGHRIELKDFLSRKMTCSDCGTKIESPDELRGSSRLTQVYTISASRTKRLEW